MKDNGWTWVGRSIGTLAVAGIVLLAGNLPKAAAWVGDRLHGVGVSTGKRMRWVDGIEDDMRRRGSRGEAVLSDAEVRSAFEGARSVARECDATYGESGNLPCDTRMMSAVDGIYVSMRSALERTP